MPYFQSSNSFSSSSATPWQSASPRDNTSPLSGGSPGRGRDWDQAQRIWGHTDGLDVDQVKGYAASAATPLFSETSNVGRAARQATLSPRMADGDPSRQALLKGGTSAPRSWIGALQAVWGASSMGIRPCTAVICLLAGITISMSATIIMLSAAGRGQRLSAEGEPPLARQPAAASGQGEELGPGCCQTDDAECLACMAGMSINEYCVMHAHMVSLNPAQAKYRVTGCPDYGIGVLGVQHPAVANMATCCQADLALCLACAAGMSAKEYCAGRNRREVPSCDLNFHLHRHSEGPVIMFMTVHNLDHARLTSAPAMKEALKDIVRTTVARAAGGSVRPGDVAVAFGEGSVVVQSAVAVPDGSNPEDISSRLAADRKHLVREVAHRIASEDKLKEATTGSVHVSRVSQAGVLLKGALDGRWHTTRSDALVDISGRTISWWSQGVTTSLVSLGGDTVAMMLKGRPYAAQLVGDKLLWDDGDVWARDRQGGCEDTDRGATDTAGDTCEQYEMYPSWCGGLFDDADFASDSMCCACGGGTQQGKAAPASSTTTRATTATPVLALPHSLVPRAQAPKAESTRAPASTTRAAHGGKSTTEPAKHCCTEHSAECLACRVGVSVHAFCAHASRAVPGCGASPSNTTTSTRTTTTSRSRSRAAAPRLRCCTADSAKCLACRAGATLAEFCARRANAERPDCEQWRSRAAEPPKQAGGGAPEPPPCGGGRWSPGDGKGAAAGLRANTTTTRTPASAAQGGVRVTVVTAAQPWEWPKGASATARTANFTITTKAIPTSTSTTRTSTTRTSTHTTTRTTSTSTHTTSTSTRTTTTTTRTSTTTRTRTTTTSTTSTTTPRPTNSLFCFALMIPWGYEPSLVSAQLDRGISIFACDDVAVYSNVSLRLGGEKGLWTRSLDVELHCELAGIFHTLYNTPVFTALWQQVAKDRVYLHHDWTVKVDPDTVFMPWRLKQVVLDHRLKDPQAGHGIFLNNCGYGLHGPIEVLSKRALQVFQAKSEVCEEPPQEDVYLQKCMLALGVKQVDRFDLLNEDHCDSKDWSDCLTNSTAFHPFKNVADYQRCLGVAECGVLEEDVAYPGEVFAVVENVSSAGACCFECSHEHKCGLWSWELEGLRCNLKTAPAIFWRRQEFGLVSGLARSPMLAVRIRSSDGNCLAVHPGRDSVHLVPCTSAEGNTTLLEALIWSFDLKNGTLLSSKGRCLDDGSSAASGTISTRPCRGRNSQRWESAASAAPNEAAVTLKSGSYICLQSAPAANASAVGEGTLQQGSCDASAEHQRWMLDVVDLAGSGSIVVP